MRPCSRLAAGAGSRTPSPSKADSTEALAIFSDAAPGGLAAAAGSGRSQSMLSGGRFLLRGGGASASGAAFGGPIAYGQQLGNGTYRVRGNAYAVHGDAANRLFTSLPAAGRAASMARYDLSELMIQAQGSSGEFGGVSLAGQGTQVRENAQELLETVLASYTASDRAFALSCIEENGGLEALHVTFYADRGFYADGARYSDLSEGDRAARPLPYFQVWRMEGPGTVIHFKGYPHVHAYINIVRNADRQNVGEVLTHTDVTLAGSTMQRFLTDTLRRETGEPLAYYGQDPHARFCAGDITTGLAIGAGGLLAFVGWFSSLLVSRLNGDRTPPHLQLAMCGFVGATLVMAEDALPRMMVGGYAPVLNVSIAVVAIPSFLWWNRRRLRLEEGTSRGWVFETGEALLIGSSGLALMGIAYAAMRYANFAT